MYAKDYPYCSTRFAAMAHRGGALWKPNEGKENTVHAFSQSVAIGYRYLETDLQASRDGRLVCMHDPTLERMTGVVGKVSDFTADELTELTVAGEPIPFFDDVVDAFPKIRFNVDLKSDDAIEPLARTIEAHGIHDRILVDSFSQSRISRFRALTRGRIPTAMAPPGVVWTALVPLLSLVISSPGVAVQVPVRGKLGPIPLEIVTKEIIDRVHRLGKVLHVWTVNCPHEMELLIDWGVDGIITDRPDVLKSVLIRRELWEDS